MDEEDTTIPEYSVDEIRSIDVIPVKYEGLSPCQAERNERQKDRQSNYNFDFHTLSVRFHTHEVLYYGRISEILTISVRRITLLRSQGHSVDADFLKGQ